MSFFNRDSYSGPGWLTEPSFSNASLKIFCTHSSRVFSTDRRDWLSSLENALHFDTILVSRRSCQWSKNDDCFDWMCGRAADLRCATKMRRRLTFCAAPRSPSLSDRILSVFFVCLRFEVVLEESMCLLLPTKVVEYDVA
jgi:hypothetical protein